MNTSLLRIRGLSKSFGGLVVTDDLDLEIQPGEVHAIIGPNGAGKTTLAAQICGELEPDAGHIFFAGEAIEEFSAPQRVRRGMARTFQVAELAGKATALENIALAVQACNGHSFGFWRNARRDPLLRATAHGFLQMVGLAERATIRCDDLAHGERKQLELAIALALKPRLLLLDEPMAGLGQDETMLMIAKLQALKCGLAMLLIEHDLDAVFALADRISVLVSGRIIFTGTPAQVRLDPQVRAAYLGDGDA